MKDQTFDCPQCGEPTDELHEGCCEACCSGNQDALDDHNFQHDRWARLGNAERSSEIKRATK
ncbi:hypothetical protein [Pseudomonas syringae]|uniref:hypothetical protein n=1 Tax=Pseudomonas syringae TaxID=317 RepID=UPI001268AC59|nr:hypothetical protein [Pseudomonas syringae]